MFSIVRVSYSQVFDSIRVLTMLIRHYLNQHRRTVYKTKQTLPALITMGVRQCDGVSERASGRARAMISAKALWVFV